jgi:molybdopterin-containing oxidoreductase family membrane subunit
MKKTGFRLAIRPFHLWVAFLGLVVAAGVAAGVQVFSKGLGITNLTDLVPWGLWITIDLSSIAMSAGAFMLCAAVYLLGLKAYQPVARTATFVGLIGYSMAVLTLLLDIGRPDRFWHSLVFWNPHSPLWEVTMCITLYFSVLVLETMPIFGHTAFMQRRLPRIATLMTRVHHFAPYLAIAGLGLSMLHQSSLGATYGVLKARPIWYRPDLSVLFMLSAMAGGPSMTLLVSRLAARLTPRANVNTALQDRVATFIGWTLVAYLYFRFWDALSMSYNYLPGRSESLSLLTGGQLSFNFWAGEILLGALVPAIILLVPRLRSQLPLQLLALALVVGGVAAYRWDTNMAGQLVVLTYLPQEIAARYTSYFPSLIEIFAGAGVVAYGVLAVSLGVRYLNLVDHGAVAEETVEALPAPAAAD